jgi:outer membrane lipoprotein-sorting protein
MIRHTMKMLLVALLASFALSSIAEAAPKKAVRHRPKHSSRVSSGTTATTTVKKKSTKKKRTTLSAKKPTARTSAKRKPTTKPR